MGLAAGQARLLTITARKSDCEFESMRLSHQKIALARELADLSNEYQNSLTQTKLYYDYYGTGDTSLPLSYNVLMTPSALNNYMPTTITDSMGRIALTGKLATAAFNAGIPQEGLGTLPSDVMRNKFVLELANAGLITPSLATTITELPYNQAAGFGGGATVVSFYEDIEYSDLVEKYFNNISVADVLAKFATKNVYNLDSYGDQGEIQLRSYNARGQIKDVSSLTLADLLNDDNHYFLFFDGYDGKRNTNDYKNVLIHEGFHGANNEIWTPLIEYIDEVLDNGTDASKQSLAYANHEFNKNILRTDRDTGNDSDLWWESNEGFHGDTTRGMADGENDNKSINDAMDYNGVVFNTGKKKSGFGGWFERNKGYNSSCAIDITTCLKQYLTYYVMAYKGLANNVNMDGTKKYNVGNSGTLSSTNKLIKDNEVLTIKTGSEVSSDDLGQATFYDALFNQICAHGWTENKNLNDNSYLQQMLQSGMLYISKMKDDGYYYQGNYSTDTYIKEVADETLIAAAEAKYNTEKAKINAKEETLDMKMKNLDTEISALTTEYDSVKSTISKQIEKSFK